MGTLRILSRDGDRQVAWDLNAVATGDAEARAAVAAVEQLFAEARARGSTAFGRSQGQAPTRLDHLDFTADEIIMVPRIVGG